MGKVARSIIVLVAVSGIVAGAQAAEVNRAGLVVASPESHGTSPERLDRLTNGVERMLKERKSPGAAMLVLRNGHIVYEKALGYQDVVTKTPMARDSIFRIYSMTKPITSVAAMMLNGGELDGVRLLSPKTVELMTANHVPDSIDRGDLYLPDPGHGFGLGFAVRTEAGVSPTAGSKGDYRWGGWAGTSFWVDPEEKLIGIFMIQDVPESGYHRDRFKALVYQAIVE